MKIWGAVGELLSVCSSNVSMQEDEILITDMGNVGWALQGLEQNEPLQIRRINPHSVGSSAHMILITDY